MNEEKQTTTTQNSATPAQVAQPVAATPAPQPVPQPATAPAPQPVPQPATAPAPAPTPVANTANVIPEVAPQQAAPTPPKGEDINAAAAPLNPIANNPQPAAQVAAPTTAPAQTAQVGQAVVKQTTTPGTYAPSGPLNTSIDTNVGYIAAGTNLKKKKNVPLILSIVGVLLVILALVGYFVVYPNIVKKLAKPRDVYYSIVDDAIKEIGNNITTLAHQKAIYNLEFELDSNIEELKDFSGYLYSGNLGIDPESKNIQAGLKIKDPSSQEHSANIYVKGERQYLRLSSYRDLIYMGVLGDSKELWDKLYEMSSNVDSEEMNYLVNKFTEYFKNGILDSKLIKEDASITISENNLKVLNNKFVIDNESVVSIVKSIRDGFVNDEKALGIIEKSLKNANMKREDIIKVLESFDENAPLLEENQVYYLNVYTYSTKNYIVGYEFVDGENRYHYYFKDKDIEIKAVFRGVDEETGKEIDSTINAVGVKEGASTKFSVTYDGELIATVLVDAWDENNKELTYNINYKDQKINGEFKLNVDTNDERSKLNLYVSVDVDGKFVKLSLTGSNDWTSDVANINAGTAVELSSDEVNSKVNEFINALKGSPLFKAFSTVSGDLVNVNIGGNGNNTSMQDQSLLSSACSNVNSEGNYVDSENIITCTDFICKNNETGATYNCKG